MAKKEDDGNVFWGFQVGLLLSNKKYLENINGYFSNYRVY